MSQGPGSKSIVITLIICTTIVVAVVVGGLIYMQKQDHAQEKQLKEFEQQQINERAEREKGRAHVDPCDYNSC